jgi:hypothetical protein
MAIKLTRRLPVVPTTKPPPEDTKLRALLQLALQKERATSTEVVKARVAIGELLVALKAALAHGQWQAFLEARTPFTPKSAERAMNLHHFSVREPALYTQLAHVGVSKLYVLMQLSPPVLAKLTAKTEHRVPSSGYHKSIANMTFKQFLEVVGAHSGKPKRLEPAHTAAFAIVRRAVSRAIRALASLAAYSAALDRDDIVDLHDDLLAATHSFGAAFALDTS